MNFIAHYYLDRNVEFPCFVMGTSTPDLASIFNRDMRIKPTHLKKASQDAMDDPNRVQFLRGIQRHMRADSLFHSAPFFVAETHQIGYQVRDRFKAAKPRRTFFVGHIAFELILDKILIERDPSLVADFYRHLEAEPVERYVSLTEWVLDRPMPGYDQFLTRFIDRRYLLHYPNIDHLTYTLRRIMGRVGLHDATYMQSTDFAAFLLDYQRTLAPRVDQMLGSIQAKM